MYQSICTSTFPTPKAYHGHLTWSPCCRGGAFDRTVGKVGSLKIKMPGTYFLSHMVIMEPSKVTKLTNFGGRILSLQLTGCGRLDFSEI